MVDSQVEDMILEQSSFDKMATDLENQELESFPASYEIYSSLLAAYMVLRDLTSCKFLWKRIPDSIKEEHTDLKDLWQLACHMWLKDWPKLNQCLLTQQHPPHLSIYINQLIKDTHDRSVKLVSSAFSTISKESLSKLIHQDHYHKVLEEKGWEEAAEGQYVIIPKKEAPPTMEKTQKLETLTRYVSFLEN